MLLLVLAGAAAAVLALRERAAALPDRPRAPTATAPEASPTPRPRPRRAPRARCPARTPGCVAVRGRVLYVERVDPDGDGDLHVVVLGGDVTLPGATAVDVAAELRPRRAPRVGDLVAAAGPVQRGHLGQSQIHALVFKVRRP